MNAHKHLTLHVDAADGIARRLSEQEDTIVRLATENAHLKSHLATLDRANELMGRELDNARKSRDAYQSQVHNLTKKLAAYHESQRTPEQAESTADTLEQGREFARRDQ
jgi:predicted RNase H-like nuclease (RuvC/YqgF family)